MLKFCRFLGGAGERFGKAFDFRRPPVSKVLRYTAPQGGRGFSPIPFRIKPCSSLRTHTRGQQNIDITAGKRYHKSCRVFDRADKA